MKKYRVNNIEDDGLYPEESLLDAVSQDAAIEKPIKSGFFVFFYFTLTGILLLFFVFGLNISILKGGYFSELSDRNRFIIISTSASRGLIYSREGDILADNRDLFSLWVLPLKLVDYNREEIIRNLSAAISRSPESIKETLDRNLNQAPFVLKENLSEAEKEKISSFNLPGLIVVRNYSRVYEDGEVFAHLLGYVSLVNEEDLAGDSSYRINDKIGQAGIERYYEEFLKGKRGGVVVSRFEDEIRTVESEKGENLVLNINSSLQKILYSQLADGLREAGLRAGMAVALDPRDGRVLALVSIPSFDSNSFTEGLSRDQYKLFFEDESEPFLNRVISGRFSPGSSIKPLIALAALKEDVISPNKEINAPGFITITNSYNPDIVYTFRDWRDHGWVNMIQAIAHSSDIYFYTIGGGYYDVEGLGISRISDYMKLFRMDSVLGIDLPGEVAGFVPTPEWKRNYKNEIWYQGDTFNVSIGQGDVLVTPLWLTNFIGSVGTGRMYRPFVADKILDEDGNIIEKFEPEIIFELPFEDEEIRIVKEGMKLAASVGTARILGDLPFEVGAKSGTAEVIKGQSTNSWISVFAPYDNPQIVLTIMMESGREGSYIPTQAAYRVLKEYFK